MSTGKTANIPKLKIPLKEIKMKKIIVLLLFLRLITSLLQAQKVAALTELLRPDMIAVGNERVYITEKTTIYIYSFKDFRLVRKFGSEGEGPREFKINPLGTPLIAVPLKDKLLVNSMAKVSFFTGDGEFIEETRTPLNQLYFPFGDSFICSGSSKNEKGIPVFSIILCSDKLEKVKNFYQSDFQLGQGMKFDFPISSLAYAPYKEKIYVAAGKEGFAIDVFDKTGKKLYRIKKEYQPLKLPADYRANTLKWFRDNPNWSQMYNVIKDRISFKTHYPAIFNMIVDSDRIYVLTYKMKDENRECVIMDLTGNEIKRVFLPIPEVYGFDYLPKFSFHKRVFYVLQENWDEEVIELHKIELD